MYTDKHCKCHAEAGLKKVVEAVYLGVNYEKAALKHF